MQRATRLGTIRSNLTFGDRVIKCSCANSRTSRRDLVNLRLHALDIGIHGSLGSIEILIEQKGMPKGYVDNVVGQNRTQWLLNRNSRRVQKKSEVDVTYYE